jgi:hypothetical protein
VGWQQKNFGKADDYGSDRFAMVNQCMIAVAHDGQPDANPFSAFSDCMWNNHYRFQPNNRVFGNSGEKCKTHLSDEGITHSWCWEKEQD